MRIVILNMPKLWRLRKLAEVTAAKLGWANWTRIDPFDHLLETAGRHPEDVASGLAEAIATVRSIDSENCLILDWRLSDEVFSRFVREVCRTGLSIDVVTITPRHSAGQSREGVELDTRDRLALSRFFRAKSEQTPSTATLDSNRKGPAQIADEIIRLLRCEPGPDARA